MNLSEQILFYQESAEHNLVCRDEALKDGRHAMAAINMAFRFNHWLTLGIIHWRLGENPVRYLRAALEGVLEDREILIGLGLGPGLLNKLPLFHSLYVASLLNAPHPEVPFEHYDETLAPAVYLGKVLNDTESIENWPLYENKLPDNKRNALARASFELYAGLLSGKISAETGVRLGEKYYRRRENDGYFQDSKLMHGGNENNDRYVDFRLGAVLKHIGSTVPSIHAWRW